MNSSRLLRLALGLLIALVVGWLHHHHGVRDVGYPHDTRPPTAQEAGQVQGIPASRGDLGPSSAGTGQVPATCTAQLPHGRAPVYGNANVVRTLRTLCFETIAVGYFPATRTPLWSAEYLTPDRVRAARTMKRNNVFHPEPSLPVNERAELADYVRSGYDRGHLSPSGDQPSASSQADSFSLANMAPQNPGLNRGPWEQLESAVRDRAQRSPLFVITGLRYLGSDVAFLHGRVAIPSTYYKLVYDPATAEATVFEAPNVEGGQPQAMDVATFEQEGGLSFGLGEVRPLTLPPVRPVPHYHDD